jgi:hypothetical protein
MLELWVQGPSRAILPEVWKEELGFSAISLSSDDSDFADTSSALD